MSAPTLPRLLDRRQVAAELGIKIASAETIMRQVPKVKIGRRVYVRDTDLKAYLDREARS